VSGLRWLALDHLTVVDATPEQLVTVAAEVGCEAVCVFLQSLDVLSRMPSFDLVRDRQARQRTRARCQALDVAIDLAYPFTLAARTEVGTLRPALETAAELGARAVNTLLYDRDAQRRLDKLAAFHELAAGLGLEVVVEFYPLSALRSLAEALVLADRIHGIRINVDLLHLMRSGGDIDGLARAPQGLLGYAQFCDGPGKVDPQAWESEASTQRRLPGEGEFDLAGFAAALPPRLGASVEIPQEDALLRGVPPIVRARRALQGVRDRIES